MDGRAAAISKPIVLITNDDGIDAPGLRFLVDVLVATDCYRVLVCAPASDQSGVSHSITWRHALSAKRVEIEGATAFAVSGTPADCASLGISGKLFDGVIPDLVISGINIGCNCGYHMMGGKSTVNDLKLAAEVCLPVINSVLTELKNKTYPEGSFLNIDVPTDVAHHKGFKITKQGKYMIRIGWEQTNINAPSMESYQTAHIDVDMTPGSEMNASVPVESHLLFKRVSSKIKIEEDEAEDTDHKALQEGYITITPLGALSHTEADAMPYFQDWLLHLADYSTSSL
uniref:Uncharacterized protein LOC105054982 isoform X2 n=1 Tax=Elaeis guineensis var. tenera TaxID=51953 RepID=A0A6I9RZ82_ELAGV|nr:uncharacterized protein LOC105054982 isoform X2 [Elaeis guineensis]